ncbi:MAG: fumarylacetoacetate hydrolase family protein [Paludibacter sp.]
MKFASIVHQGQTVYGLVEQQDIFIASAALRGSVPDLRAAIASGDLAGIATRLRQDGLRVPLDTASFAPVLDNPAQFFCAGLNYQKHREETSSKPREYPPHPVIFARFASTLTGHRQPIVKPRNSSVVDYEGELAVIIGKRGRHIRAADAYEHVAGYACANDVSMRDWQMQTSQWIPGKNFPTSCPLGPYLVTRDEAGALEDLWLRTILDGQVMQQAPFRDLIHSVPQLIAHISGFAELQPGDILLAGTPGGVGFTREPPILLEPGKVVEVQIDRIGHLINPVTLEPA